MSTLTSFGPIGGLTDFTSDSATARAWHGFVKRQFTNSIAFAERELQTSGVAGEPPFYDPTVIDTPADAVTKDIPWSAFPQRLVRTHGRARALELADQLERFDEGFLSRRQDEYCEWFVSRDQQGRIIRVTFTCESPEYWEIIAKTDPALLLKLYRKWVSPRVKLRELFVPNPTTGGFAYNWWNKWNTDFGIVHLQQINNTLGAEINIAARATLPRKDPQGRPITEARALIQCARYGEADRASDPKIGAEVNALARAGLRVSLAAPVGLYIAGLDTTGWKTRDGADPAQFWTVLRGGAGTITRAVYEVPAERGYTVSDIRIGSEEIVYGGQIAEHMTMKLTGVAFPAAAKVGMVNCLGVAPVTDVTAADGSPQAVDPEQLEAAAFAEMGYTR